MYQEGKGGWKGSGRGGRTDDNTFFPFFFSLFPFQDLLPFPHFTSHVLGRRGREGWEVSDRGGRADDNPSFPLPPPPALPRVFPSPHPSGMCRHPEPPGRSSLPHPSAGSSLILTGTTNPPSSFTGRGHPSPPNSTQPGTSALTLNTLFFFLRIAKHD